MSTRLGGISKAHTLASLRQFSGLNDMARDFLSQAVVMGHVKRHEYLVQRNGAADSFFVVVQGRVEVSLSADSGFHKVIEIAGSGDQIGEAMMFCGGNHLIDARAITAVTYIELSKADCLRAMSLDHQFAQRLIEAMSARFVTLLADIKATNCLSARERIYQFLLNEPRQDNWVRLSITKGITRTKLCSACNKPVSMPAKGPAKSDLRSDTTRAPVKAYSLRWRLALMRISAGAIVCWRTRSSACSIKGKPCQRTQPLS
jgi:CRP-like cAMP-binding protein